MKTLVSGLFALATLTLLLMGCDNKKKLNTETSGNAEDKEETTQVTVGVERLDTEIDQLIPEGAEVEFLAEGFQWAEGPLWIADGEYLLFTDVPQNTIYKWKAGEGKSVYLKPSGYTVEEEGNGGEGANGLLLDSEGNLVLCQHGDRRMAKMMTPLSYPRPDFATLTEKYDGKRYNSPNDAAFHKDGSLYFTDPPYGLPQKNEDPLKEIPFQGVYRLTSDGEVALLTQKLTRPNGIAFSPDYQTLYVANSDPEKALWMAYDVTEDGGITNERVFFDATDWTKTKKGLPDGLKVGKNGHLFATGPGGVLVFTPKGKHIGTIKTGSAIANCAFGDDGAFLYMTAHKKLARIALNSQLIM